MGLETEIEEMLSHMTTKKVSPAVMGILVASYFKDDVMG